MLVVAANETLDKKRGLNVILWCVFVCDRSRCWGKGYWGQLGDEQYHARGKYPDEMGPKLNTVSLGTGVTASILAAGSDHTCAALNDGSLKVRIAER